MLYAPNIDKKKKKSSLQNNQQ